MPDGVRDDDPALVTTGSRILVSVLERLQLLPVTVPEVRGAWLYMDVVHVTRTIRKAGYGVEQRGTDKVTDLKPGVVFAMSEGRQLNEVLVALHCRTELLRKNGVGNGDIFEFVSAVGDAYAGIVGLGQIVFEVGTDSLYRGRVHRSGMEWQAKALHPDACNQLDVMVSQQTKNSVEEADGMRSLPRSSTCCVAANVGAFCLGQDSVKRLGGRIG